MLTQEEKEKLAKRLLIESCRNDDKKGHKLPLETPERRIVTEEEILGPVNENPADLLFEYFLNDEQKRKYKSYTEYEEAEVYDPLWD